MNGLILSLALLGDLPAAQDFARKNPQPTMAVP